ncbi:MAG TPA: amidohydrolase [Labilithrix sp.]|nr:amidohydrolase [Labilithrix sp.]
MPRTRARVLLGGNVCICDGSGARGDAIAWQNDRVLAVGGAEDVLTVAGPDAEVTDVGGRTILPGFIDAHHHASIVALYGGSARLVPPAVTDIASLQAILREAARRSGNGWVVATDWDEALLVEGRAPTRQELDDAVPDRPVFALHYSCHRAVVNSRALEAVGIDHASVDPVGGEIVRGKNGSPTGLLIERAMSRAERRARESLIATDVEGFFERLAAHYRALVAAGITRVVDATVPTDLAVLYREANRRGLLTIPTVIMPVSTTGYLEAPWDALESTPTGETEGALEIGPVKLVFDGAPSCAMCLGWWQTGGVFVRTLAMSLRQGTLAPIKVSLSLAPRIGQKLRTGILLYQPEEAQSIVRAACDRGFSIATHAIGNEAIAAALGAYEAAGPDLHRTGKARLEHVSFVDRELVKRIADLGAAAVMQPHFVHLPALEHAPTIPGIRYTPLRWLLDAGVTVAGSSDFPVASFDPLDGIRSAVQRRSRQGEVREPDQRIRIDEAILMYTKTAAEVTGANSRCGTLTAGKRADLVVLDRPLDTDSLDSVRVQATVVGGKLVHGEL